LALLAANAVAYALCGFQGCILEHAGVSQWLSIAPEVVGRWGLDASAPSLLSFLTAPWLHLDLLHLTGNLLFLGVIGAAAEGVMGGAALIGIYLAGSIGAELSQVAAAAVGLTDPGVIYAGSSGAVIALIAAFTVRRYRARIRIWMLMRDLAVPVGILALIMAAWYGLMPVLTGFEHDAYWGHLGGVVAGLICALALRMPRIGATDYSLEDALGKVSKGLLREGIQDLEALSRVLPDEPRVPMELARVYRRVWDRPAAGKSYGRAIHLLLLAGKAREGMDVWRESLEDGTCVPHPPALALADAAVLAGYAEGARDIYEWLLQVADPDTSRVVRKRVEALDKSVGRSP
jgi:membrane associated rhomboid family serine protease